MKTNQQVTKELALRLVDRVRLIAAKGKHADDIALQYFIGAAAAAIELGNHSLAIHLTTVASVIVATQGMRGVRTLLDAHTVNMLREPA